jgi:hypothetical protein
VLAHYQPELPTRVETDALDGVVAAVLSQLQEDDEWHPVAYYSHTMAPAEVNYDIHNKEMLAIIRALEEWRPELVGLQREDRFEILSDHQALEYFMSIKKLNARQAYWCEFLHDYFFILKYRPERVNVLADTLTRREGTVTEKNLNHRHQTLLPREVLDSKIIKKLNSLKVMEIDITIDIISRVVLANHKTVNSGDWASLIAQHKD